MAASRNIPIKTPSLPNFVEIGTQRVDVADLSEPEIKALGDDWTVALSVHASQRRRQRDKDTEASLRGMTLAQGRAADEGTQA